MRRHQALSSWGYTSGFIDRLVLSFGATGIFNSIWNGKLFALRLLLVSLIGVNGKKDEKISLRNAILYMVCGLLLYLSAHVWLLLPDRLIATCLMLITTMIGYLLILAGGTWISRIIKVTLGQDIFNKDNETFPQEERRLENEYSINLPARYRFRDSVRKSFINIINPFRALTVLGGPGSG